MKQYPLQFAKALEKNRLRPVQVRTEAELVHALLKYVNAMDPDLVVGHNITGDALFMLQSSFLRHKLAWWEMGRLRYKQPPRQFAPSEVAAKLVSGRLVVDTYTSAKELIHEDDYSLPALAAKYTSIRLRELNNFSGDVLFSNATRLCTAIQSNLIAANAAAQLMFSLLIVPLTHQISCISGLPWGRCLRSNRSERVEYYLLHGFRQKNFITPDKQRKVKQQKRKSKYEGGLVLEPKADLYEDFVLVLDFNSLYPSIIQEYNLCYTTVKREKKSEEEADEEISQDKAKRAPGEEKRKEEENAKEEGEDEDGDLVVSDSSNLTRGFPRFHSSIVPELPQTVEESQLAPLPSVFCLSNPMTRS